MEKGNLQGKKNYFKLCLNMFFFVRYSLTLKSRMNSVLDMIILKAIFIFIFNKFSHLSWVYVSRDILTVN